MGGKRFLRLLLVGLFAALFLLFRWVRMDKPKPAPNENATPAVITSQEIPAPIIYNGLALEQTGAFQIIYRDQLFTVFVAHPQQNEIRLHLKDQQVEYYSSTGNLLAALTSASDSVLMLMNAGMYMEDQTPLGLYIEEGEELKPINLADPNDDNFYLKPNGVFYIDGQGLHILRSEKYAELQPAGVSYATQSGPLLLEEGQVHPALTQGSDNQHIRNGVGVNGQGQAVFAISEKPVNFYDFASLFKDALACPNALYLDGFVSRMYAPPYR